MSGLKALAVVAHPDDETLWAGGTILSNPGWFWTVASLCRAGDPDRAPKFRRAAAALGAVGRIGELDDGPDQEPLDDGTVESAVQVLVPEAGWDVIFTHSPHGEYSRHRRHEEVSRAVTSLWKRGEIETGDLRLFAYEDGGRSYHPRAIETAHLRLELTNTIWLAKRRLIEQVYGFSSDSWEARSAGKVEAFWRFTCPDDYLAWVKTTRDPFTGG